MLAAGITFSIAGISTAWVEEFVHPGVEASFPVVFLAWISSWTWGIGPLLSGTFLLLLFPDGRLPSARWRPVARAIGVGIVMMVASIAFTPGPMDVDASVDIVNPFGIGRSAAPMTALATIGLFLALGGLLLSVASLFARYRRAVAQTRLQIRWLAYAAIIVVVFLTAGAVIESTMGERESRSTTP
jgi:hypothetical protein